MRIGKLRHYVALQSRGSTQDTGTGIVTETWSTQSNFWAHIEPINAREMPLADIPTLIVNTRITMRYQTGVLPSMRIVEGANVYQIVGIQPDPRSGTEYLVLNCSQVING